MEKLTEGIKYDEGKLRYDLVPVDVLEALVKIYTDGAVKYEDNNWRKGMRWGKIFAGTMRHLWAFWKGEENDKESGSPHLAHAAWGCLTLLNYTTTQKRFDDRVFPGKGPDISDRARVDHKI